jgi:pyoverdine/dityrosine biosynthesis protein Dit1
MSVVTGVMLITHCVEDAQRGYDPFILINTWLDERGFGALIRVDDATGGSKHPQYHAFGAGFNYFHCRDEFVELITKQIEWDEPSNVVLILQPEDGRTEVYRPI